MVKIGIIGTGKWGVNHLRVFSEIDAELVALSDINPDKKELAEQYNIKFFTDFKEMLPLVDAVSVVVPTDKHYNVVKECLLNDKHVFVEKPITLDHKEAEELAQIANERGLTLQVGYLFRYNAAVLEMRKQLKNLGDLHYITARFIHSTKPPRQDSGVIFNFAVHLIDTLNFILDKTPKSVYCKKLNYLSEEREDCALITMDYGDFIANIEVSWFHPEKKRDAWFIGSKEKVYLDMFEQIVKRHPIEVTLDKVDAQKEINVEVHKNEPLKDQLIDFCNNVKKGVVIKDVGINTTKLCEACLQSAKEGKEVVL